METFDVIVIGAGSGTGISSRAAARGLAVALVERGQFGGTCINRGCVTSKGLIHSADVLETIRGADRFGIGVPEDVRIDWASIVQRTAQHADRTAEAIEEESRASENQTVFKGEAKFVEHKTIEVNGAQIRGETIVIAVGSRPAIPPILGLDTVPYLTSWEALRLPTQPSSLVVVGGGAIAVELAHFFGTLGTNITIVELEPRLLPLIDDEIGERFTDVYRRRFDVYTGSRVKSVRRDGSGVIVAVESADGLRQVGADAILVATGRRPNTDTLDLERTGVEMEADGTLKTDEYLRTNVEGIWALGDVAGHFQLKHSGDLESGYVAKSIFNPEAPVAVDYHAMPQAIFSSPQVGVVGLTERQARERGIDYVVNSKRFDESSYGGIVGDHDGLVKVLATPSGNAILGCHMIGTEASILIQEVSNAMRMRLGVGAITDSVYIHPALQEVVRGAFEELELRL